METIIGIPITGDTIMNIGYEGLRTNKCGISAEPYCFALVYRSPGYAGCSRETT